MEWLVGTERPSQSFATMSATDSAGFTLTVWSNAERKKEREKKRVDLHSLKMKDWEWLYVTEGIHSLYVFSRPDPVVLLPRILRDDDIQVLNWIQSEDIFPHIVSGQGQGQGMETKKKKKTRDTTRLLDSMDRDIWEQGFDLTANNENT